MKFNYLLATAMIFTVHKVMAGGPIEGCLQTHTVVAGDSCEGIAANFKLTPEEFYGMNPGLHHAGDHLCDNLDDGKGYCVCTKKPCVDEPAPTQGNSTVSVSGSGASPGVNATHDATLSTNANSAPAVVAAAAGSSSSPSSSSSSSSQKSPSTAVRSVSSSSSPAASGAVSEKMSRSCVPFGVLLLSALAIVSL